MKVGNSGREEVQEWVRRRRSGARPSDRQNARHDCNKIKNNNSNRHKVAREVQVHSNVRRVSEI